ncbi:MAG: outer membrane lipoprotein-sorting protein [Ignavibacteria bacterium]|jgi:outer membrane lipoprotein-sorting protein
MKLHIKLMVLVTLLVSTIYSQELTPKEIVKKVDDTERIASSKGIVKQVITTSGGKERILKMESYTKDENRKQFMIYTEPSRVKGDKILMLNDGDDIWFYTPKTDRVRHLASHAKRQKVQGSDFSYEDLSSIDYEKDYTYKLLGEEIVNERLSYKFEMIPTETGPHYSKIILWADKERFYTNRIDYYEDDQLLKRLINYEIEYEKNHWYSYKMVMTNIKEGGETIMETESIEFDLELKDEIFSTTYLKRR